MVGYNKLKRRMKKVDRATLKMWAEGCREGILLPHIEPYADASARSFVAERDYVRCVQNEYHQLIHWRLPDDEEPPLPLPVYDPNLITPPEDLTDEDQILKSRTIAKKNIAIRRWLKYRVRALKLAGSSSAMDPAKNPYAALLAQLSGIPPAPIRARQGWQQFMHERYSDVIAPAVAAAWDDKVKKGLQTSDKNNTGFRANVARMAFNSLPKEEQQAFLASAQKDKEDAVAAYKLAVQNIYSGSHRPENRQQCLDKVATFMTPILQGLKDLTGYTWVLLGGGPNPRAGGEMGTVHLNAGHNLSTRPMYWRQWNEQRFDAEVIPFFKAFLHTCYTDEERAAAALSTSLDGAAYLLDDQFVEDDASDEEHSSSDSGSDTSSVDSDIPQASHAVKSKGKSGRKKGSRRAAGAVLDNDESKKRKRPSNDPIPPPLKRAKPPPPAGIVAVGPSTAAAAAAAATFIRPSTAAAAALASFSKSYVLPLPPPAAPAVPPAPSSSAPALPALPSSSAPAVPPAPPVLAAARPRIGGKLSQYEMEKEANIRANKAFLNALGVDHAPEPRKTAVPRKRILKVPGGQPPRRSGRHTAVSTDADDDTTMLSDDGAANASPLPASPSPPVLPLSERPPPPGSSTDSALLTPPAGGSDAARCFVPPAFVNATWLKLPLHQISSCDLGKQFSRTLDMLCALENASAFVNKTRGFATTGRPAQLDAWVRAGRGSKGGSSPHVSDAPTFAEVWWGWWLSLQPEWRGSSRPLSRGVCGGSWDRLVTPGANGMLGVVACLYWWGRTANELALEAHVVDAGSVEGWLDAVNDVNYVLEGLLITDTQ